MLEKHHKNLNCYFLCTFININKTNKNVIDTSNLRNTMRSDLQKCSENFRNLTIGKIYS